MAWASSSLWAGAMDFTPSIPAVFLPWLSCVTRRTAMSRAASDFCNNYCTLWTFHPSPFTAAGSNAFLQSEHTLLQLVPGQRGPVYACHFWLRYRCLIATHAFTFSPTVPTSAPAGFLGNPSSSLIRSGHLLCPALLRERR